ncbi:MAG: hypothetical protein IH840_03535 [Candidatus Heimdallarchaeota archaeon]|nr:hypothetical protein [Candidatus Heimdallarchaeota archaeon]
MISLAHVPISSFIEFDQTNFQIGDTFTFRITHYDFNIIVNETSYLNLTAFNLPSLGEPFDVSVTNITATTETTSLDYFNFQHNVTTSINFHNPNLVDPTGEFHSLTDDWAELFFEGVFFAALYFAFFDPALVDFNATTDFDDETFDNPDNTSLLFPDQGGSMIVPIFLGSNDAIAATLYDDYVLLEDDENFTGSLNDGFSANETIIEVTGNDTSITDFAIFRKVAWNNISKVFEMEFLFDASEIGTFNNGSSYFNRSFFSLVVSLDYNRGIVNYFSNELLIEFGVLNASILFGYSFGFTENLFTPPTGSSGTTISQSTSDDTGLTTETITGGSSSTGRDSTTETTEISSDPSSDQRETDSDSDQNITNSENGQNGTSDPPNPVNYPALLPISISFIIVIIYRRRTSRLQ